MAKKKTIPVIQEDWYTQATDYEEQAERWMLSDIKKTLRFYLQALECYERALRAPESTPNGSYHILYNETRMLLQIHTEYVANSGYINILAYLKLDDMPSTSNLIISLPGILQRFQAVRDQYRQEITWDFNFNMLTCYSSLLESAAASGLQGGDVVQMATIYAELTQSLTQYLMQELKDWHEEEQENSEEPTPQEESARDPRSVISNDDGGGANSPQKMEVADQITAEALSEVLCNGFKCVQTLMELMVESQNGDGNVALNAMQLSFLEDLTSKFLLQLNDMRTIAATSFPLQLMPADIACMTIEAIGYLTTDLPAFETYVQSFPNDKPDILLAKIDILQFAIDCSGSAEHSTQWSLCTMLNKILTEACTHFMQLRSRLMAQPASEELSKVTFQLCDMHIDSSDNEFARFIIRRSQQRPPPDDKTSQILLKNAKTLLINAARIAERPCGLQETIVDKLKRNYIYNQARTRLSALDNQAHSELDLLDHPYYKSLAVEP